MAENGEEPFDAEKWLESLTPLHRDQTLVMLAMIEAETATDREELIAWFSRKWLTCLYDRKVVRDAADGLQTL